MSIDLKNANEVHTLIDSALSAYFISSINQAGQIDASYRQLWEVLYRLIQSGGKRLRPRMTLLAYEAFGGENVDKIIPVAAAQELLHFSLLIHDDIIDRDFIRYDSLNVTGQYKTIYGQLITDEKEVVHYANAAALLGGDLMLAGAHELITASYLTDVEKTKASALLAKSIFEVAGGELLDTESSFAPYVPGGALKIARYKTAGYSFISPLSTGATLAKATPKQIAALRVYATSLGTAYQLVDDILGVFGDKFKTGKSTSGDIIEGKRTFMAEHALSNMTRNEKTAFLRGFGNTQATDSEVQAVRDLFISSGAYDATKEAVMIYAEEARQAITLFSVTKKYENLFEDLIKKVTERSQ